MKSHWLVRPDRCPVADAGAAHGRHPCRTRRAGILAYGADRPTGSAAYARELLARIAPSRADDAALVQWLAASQRRSAPPYAGESRWIAGQIPAARLLSMPGPDHMLISGNTDAVAVVDEIERFLTGRVRTTPQLDRVLATVLFTNLVESTQRLINAGDRGWADLVGQHHAIVRGLLKTYRGWENDTAGDGFFATFDGPTRAVRCAREIVRSIQLIGLAVRAGIQAGECETADGKAAGIAVGHRGTSDGSSGRRPDPGYQHPERPRGRFWAHLHRRRSARAQGNPRHVAPLCGRGWLSGHRDDPAAAAGRLLRRASPAACGRTPRHALVAYSGLSVQPTTMRVRADPPTLRLRLFA